jgi:hypothetical protein
VNVFAKGVRVLEVFLLAAHIRALERHGRNGLVVVKLEVATVFLVA